MSKNRETVESLREAWEAQSDYIRGELYPKIERLEGCIKTLETEVRRWRESLDGARDCCPSPATAEGFHKAYLEMVEHGRVDSGGP